MKKRGKTKAELSYTKKLAYIISAKENKDKWFVAEDKTTKETFFIQFITFNAVRVISTNFTRHTILIDSFTGLLNRFTLLNNTLSTEYLELIEATPLELLAIGKARKELPII